MSEEVRCDVCKKPGRRRMGQIAPADWSYGESDMVDGVGNVVDQVVVYACSQKCREKFWNNGPGKLDLGSYIATQSIGGRR